MKASPSLHHHASSSSSHGVATHHPWLATLCVLFGLGVVALAVFWIRRCKSNVPRHEYTAVSLDSASAGGAAYHLQHGADERRHADDEELQRYQRHLGADSRYFLTGSLGRIGVRANKQWFVVKDKHLDADRLLTLVDLPPDAPVRPCAAHRAALTELFRSIHHPYILPILDVEFWELGAHAAGVAVVAPLAAHGSLRDLIYGGVDYDDTHERKYQGRGHALPYRQIQYLARQILEALTFLRARSFPRLRHLHAGNVVIQNGVARLAGLENTLLCLPPTRRPAEEVFAFGHLLFEMTTGCELSDALLASPLAVQRELDRAAAPAQIADVVSLIFDTHPAAEAAPSLEHLMRQELFKGVELRELCRRTSTSAVATLRPCVSKGVADLLQAVANIQQQQQQPQCVDGGARGTPSPSPSPTTTTTTTSPAATTATTTNGASNVDADAVETLSDVFRRRCHHEAHVNKHVGMAAASSVALAAAGNCGGDAQQLGDVASEPPAAAASGR